MPSLCCTGSLDSRNSVTQSSDQGFQSLKVCTPLRQNWGLTQPNFLFFQYISHNTGALSDENGRYDVAAESVA